VRRGISPACRLAAGPGTRVRVRRVTITIIREKTVSGQRAEPASCDAIVLHTVPGGGDLLALAFGTTVATWAVGYIGHMPLVRLPTAVLVGLMLACMVAGGWAAGRYTSRGLSGGAQVGLISATLDLLIFGSLLTESDGGSPVPAAWLWIPAWLVLSTILASLGTLAGAFPRNGHRKLQVADCKLQIGDAAASNWAAALAWIACAATMLLLAAGGLVTGFRAGMAVPDWPNTFGSNMFLYPLAKMTGGVFYEHAHRLLGTLAGLAALALAIQLRRTMPERASLVRCTWLVGTAVAVQGVFGGFRVVDDSHCLAVVHGFFAHAIFGGLVAVAAVLTRDWPLPALPARIPPTQSAGFSGERCPPPTGYFPFAAMAITAILLQTLLGALVRQLGVGVFSHLALVVAVVLASLAAGVAAWRSAASPAARRCATALMLLLAVQAGLGLAAFVFRTPAVAASPNFEALAATGGRLPVAPLPALLTTVHQTTAAVLLALAVALAVYVRPMGGQTGPAQPQAALDRQNP
jgi:cytochrome c oxidase assembly protein subunit 15